jgi:hypothetical protein
MTHHAGNHTLEPREGSDDTDRAEQTADDVVGATKVDPSCRNLGSVIPRLTTPSV